MKHLIRDVLRVAWLLPRHPVEVYDRLCAYVEMEQDHHQEKSTAYQPWPVPEIIEGIEACLKASLSEFLTEPAVEETEQEIRQRIGQLPPGLPLPLIFNADFTLARLCYAMCRTLRPRIVMETGVAYGVTSTFILKAMQVNNSGTLHSVDLPSSQRGAEQAVGILIPETLRERWQLYRGVSRRLLPRLLPKLRPVELFIHDSMHTYRNMLWEFHTVRPYLAARGALISDDVSANAAFLEWVNSVQPDFWAVSPETDKDTLFGVSLFCDAGATRY